MDAIIWTSSRSILFASVHSRATDLMRWENFLTSHTHGAQEGFRIRARYIESEHFHVPFDYTAILQRSLLNELLSCTSPQYPPLNNANSCRNNTSSEIVVEAREKIYYVYAQAPGRSTPPTAPKYIHIPPHPPVLPHSLYR